MRSRFIRQRPPPGLMLTSLLDMFTIILIFLIVSFDAQSQKFQLNPKIKLPESTSRSILKPAVSLVVTADAVIIGDKPVVRLAAGRATPSNYDAQEIPELVDALKKEYTQRFGDTAVSQEPVMAGDEEIDPTEPIIVVQADRSLEYETLYLVLRSAATAGFFKYRLATLKT